MQGKEGNTMKKTFAPELRRDILCCVSWSNVD